MGVTVKTLGEYSATIELLKTLGDVRAQDAVNVINSYNLTPAQFAEFAEGFYGSNVEPWYSELGVPSAGYRVISKVPVNPSTGSIGAELNSNAGSTQIAQIKTPIEMAVDQTTGKVTASTGLTKVATGAKSTLTFISKEVLPAIAAAGVGIKLGTAIDRLLYNAAPDFWDSAGLSSLNPDTWGSITQDYPDGFLKSAFNTIFGIDTSTGNAQMYLDERAFAYLAQFMQGAGFFSTGGLPGYEADEFINNDGLTLINPNIVPLSVKKGTSFSFVEEADPTYTLYVQTNIPVVAYYGYYTSSQTTKRIWFASDKPYLISRVRQKTELPPPVITPTGPASQYTRQGVTAYMGGSNASLLAPGYDINPYVQYSGTSERGWDIAAAIFHNDATTETGDLPDGVSHQPGATIPDFGNCTTQQDYIDAIQDQFPDIYNDAVSQTYVDPNTGEEETVTFLPIGMPLSFLYDEDTDEPIGDQPVTDPDRPGEAQEDDGITPSEYEPDPDNPDSPSLEDLLELLMDLILDIIPSGYDDIDPDPGPDPGPDPDPETNPDAKPDTDNPTDPSNPDPTGFGDTPAVIIPTGSASALWSVYNPSQSELNSFGAWLWSSNFIDQLLKLFNNPMQSIIGVHKIYATPPISGAGNIVVGYLDSGVSANIVSGQYVNVDCGSVTLAEHFGNVFDYTDTHVKIYLPFIGIVPLDTADIMRGTISVMYHVDVITGACLADVAVRRDASGGTLYQFAGDAAVRYPISSGSYMGIVAGIASAVGGIASAVMTGGASIPIAAGAVAGGVANAHANVQHSGSFAGNAGAMGCKKPYLIIERPQTMIADSYEQYEGIGANQVVSVGQMSGYFRLSNVKTASVPGATDEELQEIKTVLENGALK